MKRPKSLSLLIFPALFLASGLARADGSDRTPDKDSPYPRPHEVCFNVFCSYAGEGSGDFPRKCEAGAVFRKLVGDEGEEIPDISSGATNPAFEIACDGRPVFNSAAHRFTDHQGTRLQAESGPFPAVVLPRGALRDGHRYVSSSLELGGRSLEGYCYVYTGPQ